MVALVAVVALALILRPGDRATEEISYQDQSAWMVSRASGEIVRVNGTARDVATRVELAEPGARLELVPVGEGAAVLNRDAGELSLIDGVGLDVVASVALDEPADAQLVSNGRHAYLVTRDEVQPITAEPLEVGVPLELDAPISSPVVGDEGALWAIERRDGVVRTFEPDGDDDRFDGEFTPETSGLAVAAGHTLLVDLDADAVTAIDGGPEPTDCEQDLPDGAPVLGYSSTTTVSDPFVTVSDADRGAVVVWDVSKRQCHSIEIADPGAELGAAVVDGSTGYVPDYSEGAVAIVDLRTGTSLGRVGVAPAERPFELFEHNGDVWFNNPFGSDSALLDRGGIVTVIEKLGEGSGDSAVGAEEGDGGPITGGDAADDGGLGLDPAEGDEGTAGSDGAGGETGEGDGAGGPAGGDSDPGADTGATPPVADEGSEDDDEPDPDADLIANFTFSTSTTRVGEPVEFVDQSDGAPTSWSWTFGDGTADDGPIVSKLWESEGTYEVMLTVDRDDGASDSASVDIVVLSENAPVPPVADFAFTSSTVEVGQLVTFSDRSSGSPSSWEWDFGDGAAATGQTVTHSYSRPGRFTVTLQVGNDEGFDARTAAIDVVASVDRPDAEIAASTLNPAVGQFVNFQSESTGAPSSESWSFGDGSSASGRLVGHAYTAPGTYTVTLTATNSAGSDTATVTVVVSDDVLAPVARFTASSTSVQEGQTVVFTSTSLNGPDTLTWNFGDGASASGQSVTHAFGSAGSFTVTLLAQNRAGSSTFSLTIDVAPGGVEPVASFDVSNAAPSVGEVVQFTDTSANGPTSWAWDFGDGATSAAANPPHAFGEAGTFTVTLTVTNGAGSDSTAVTVAVAPPPPSAAFTSSASVVEAGQPVTFTDLSTGDPQSWSWRFGDGATSTAQNPTHVFTAAGDFNVILEVGNDGGTSIATRTIEVIPPPPVASFTFAPASGVTTADVVQFTDSSTNATSWSWDFGDGATSTAQNPTHQYGTPGTYTVRLVASNSADSSSATQTIAVAQAVIAPVADFTVSPPGPVPAGTTVSFADASANGPTSWTWTMPNGSTRTGPSTSFAFASAGTFNISLTVANSAGSATATKSVTVLPPPPVAGFTFSVAADGRTVSFVDTSSGGPTSWSWSFGDGASSADRNPVHVYGAGTFTVTLVVSNAGGSSAPAAQTITINPTPPPTASFTFSVNNLTASFNDTSGGVISSWSWSFGDGSGSGAQSPAHAYTVAGTYTVSLTVTGPGGSSSTSAPVTVTDPPPPPTSNPPN